MSAIVASPAMDTIFRSKNRTRNSASSTSNSAASASGLSYSIPYNQTSSAYPAPIAGPSASTISLVSTRREQYPRKEDVSAPLSNPALNGLASPTNAKRFEGQMPPPSNRVTNGTGQYGGANGDAVSPGGSIKRVISNASTSKGLRYQLPSVSLGMGDSSTPPQEFSAQSRHPYAASGRRDSETASIRTVSSANSAQQPIRDLGRYPSFAESRVSLSSRNSSTPNGRAGGPSSYAASIHTFSSNKATQRLSEEFDFPRPSDGAIEDMFQTLLENRDLDKSCSQVPSISSRNSLTSPSLVNVAKHTSALPIETKWQMVASDARARHDQAKEQRKREEEMLKAGKSKRGSAGVHVKNSPEWFLKKVLDGSLTAQHLVTLNVSLRSFPLE